MAKQDYAINGIPIKSPTLPGGFKIERYNITNMERLANGTMAGDFIAKKRKFYFTYESISASDLDVILDAIWETEELFMTLTYVENNVEKSAKVYVGSIPSDLHHTGGDWVWQNVTFNLIEQ